jgi:hypothetical protein
MRAGTATTGTPGAAVEVFVNGNSVGFADPISGSGNTKFRYTFAPGVLPVRDTNPNGWAFFPADSGGWLHNVKASVTIFDGQGGVAAPAPAEARTQLSEPLDLVVDDVDPAAPSVPDLVETSDSGDDNTDHITNIIQPAFDGTGEHNAKVRIYANGNLVGEGRVGTDETDNGFDQIGWWEVTVEPLKYGQFEITAEVEDLAGNVSVMTSAMTPLLVVDPYEPNDSRAEATILGSLPKIT